MATDAEKRIKQLKVRNEVIKELVQTEQRYVEDLTTIVDVYVIPLKTAKNNLIPAKDLYSIFSNIQLLLNVNKELLKDLTKVSEISGEQQIVGEIFLKLADYLKMYNQYCGNQGKALNIVEELKKNKGFSLFLDEAMMEPRCRNEPLNSFLIKPIQRICRYPLLLKELLKNTPNDHVDFESLTAALTKVTEVVTEVNESQRKGENIQKILEIQNLMEQPPEFSSFKLLEPGRRFIQEITFTKQPTGKQLRFFMFNDILIYGRPSQMKKNGFLLRGIIYFEKAVIRNNDLIEIDRLDVNKTMQLKIEKADERALWSKNLQEVLENMEKRRKEKENVTTKLLQLDPTELLARKEEEINEWNKKIAQLVSTDERQFKDLAVLIEKSLESYKKRLETQIQLETLQEERLILLAYQKDEQLVGESRAKRKKEKKAEKKKEDDRRATQEEKKGEMEVRDDSDELKVIKTPPPIINLWEKPLPESTYVAFSTAKVIAAHTRNHTPTPEIVLVGEQGSGKSALLEALIGIPFNFLGRGATKRPLFLHLVNNVKCEEIKMYFKKDSFMNLEDLSVNRQQIPDELAKRNETLSPEPIVLIFEYKFFWDITFIDTPGLIPKKSEETENAEDGDPVKGDEKLIQKMISKLIRPTHRFIVALEQAKDWKTSALENFIRKTDQTLTRSLFVFTKFHLLVPFIHHYDGLNGLANFCPGDVRNSYFVSLFSNKLRNRIAGSSNSIEEFRDKIRRSEQRDLQNLRELRYDQEIGYNCGLQPLLGRILDESWQRHKDNIPRTTELVFDQHKEAKKLLSEQTAELHQAEKTLKQTRQIRIATLREVCSQYLQDYFLTFHQIYDGSFLIQGDLLKIWQEWDKSNSDSLLRAPLWDRRLLNGGAQVQSLISAFRSLSNELEIKLSSDEVRMITVYMKQTNELVVRATELAQQKFRQAFEPIIDELVLRGVHIVKQIVNLVDYYFRVYHVKKHALNNSLHLGLKVRDIFLGHLNQKAENCREKCLRELKAPHLIFWELSSSDRELFSILKKASIDDLPNDSSIGSANNSQKDSPARLSFSLRESSSSQIVKSLTDPDLPLNKRVIKRYQVEGAKIKDNPALRKRESNINLSKRDSAMPMVRREGSSASFSSRSQVSADDNDEWAPPQEETLTLANAQAEARVVGLACELFIEIRRRISRNVLLKFHEFFLLPLSTRKAEMIGEFQQVFGDLSDDEIEKLFSVDQYFEQLKEDIHQSEASISVCSQQLAILSNAANEIAKLKSNPLNSTK